MPITVYYNNDDQSPCTIRPTPLISVNSNILKNGAGESFGVTYVITFNGTLIAKEGTPYAFKTNDNNSLFEFYTGVGGSTNEIDADKLVGPYKSFDNSLLFQRPSKQAVPDTQMLGALLSKQKSLRSLFSIDGQRVDITDWAGLDPNIQEKFENSVMTFYPRITNISFQEGLYVDKCDYTITMEADVLYSNPLNTNQQGLTADADATFLMASSGMYNIDDIYGLEKVESTLVSSSKKIELVTEKDLRDLNQSFINNFSEEWSIEADEQFGENFGDVDLYSNTEDTPFRDLIQPKSYRITHTISADGKTHYGPLGKNQAWKEAKKFVQNRLVHGTTQYSVGDSYPNIPFGESILDFNTSLDDGSPNPNLGQLVQLPGFFGSGALNLATHYNGFNHTRNENIDISNGSYSVTETWLVASGTDYENYSMSVTSDNQNPFVTVNIQGQIKGLSSLVPSSVYFGGQYADHKLIPDTNKKDPRFLINPYYNALDKWYKISKSGVFGYNSDIYRRANSTVAVELNSQPLDISLGMNEYTGEIDYSLSFDNRPTNIISGVLFENISVNETYPGDVYSLIPVIGRATGPILQYNGSRTAHSRDLSIDLIMDSTKIPYDTGRKMLQRRPSAVNPTAEQIEKLIYELSPQYEPGIKKYFQDAPQETWNPKTGQYSFNIRWTYELDK